MPQQPEIVSDCDCVGCGHPAMSGDFPTPLCADCRRKFVRFPIPVWIRIFAACIGALVLFSLFTFPKDLSLGISLEKGERAEKEKRFVTAQREMEKILAKVPGNIEAEGHLMIDAFYNEDLQTFAQQFKQLKDVPIKDKTLLDSIESVMTKAVSYFGDETDSFGIFKTSHPDLTKVSDADWTAYMDRNPRDLVALIAYANLLFNQKEYDRTDSCLWYMLKVDREFYPALGMLTSTKRQEGQLDSALFYSDRLLSINRELPYGLATRARTLLMKKKDQEALDLASKAYQMRSDHVFIQGTLIMAYHFNHQMKERDALIQKARSEAKDSVSSESLQYALDVINNKEKFRD